MFDINQSCSKLLSLYSFTVEYSWESNKNVVYTTIMSVYASSSEEALQGLLKVYSSRNSVRIKILDFLGSK